MVIPVESINLSCELFKQISFVTVRALEKFFRFAQRNLVQIVAGNIAII